MYKNKTAIVTGGGAGIGRELCLEIARRGGVSIVGDINLQAAEHTANQIITAGGKSLSLEMDVTDQAQVKNAVEFVAERYGKLDYFFNNAGIALAAEVRDMSYERWEKIIAVNLWGVIYGSQEAYWQMLNQESGHIVNISSMAGITANVSAAAYSATKFAVRGLTDALRLEAKSLGISVSLVCPASVKTAIRDHIPMINTDVEGYLEEIGDMHQRKGIFHAWSAERAATYILDKMEQKQALILLPPGAKVIHFLNRWFPGLVEKQQVKFINRFRKYRIEDGNSV